MTLINPFIFGGAAAGYSDIVLADSPLGYWRLNETVGATSAADSGSGGNPLAQEGAVTFGSTTKPNLGTSVATPGTATNRLRYAGVPVGMGASGVTIEAWAEFAPPQFGAVFHLGDTTSNGYGIGVGNLNYQTSGSNLVGLFEGVRWIASGVSMSAGWHHIAMTVVSGTAKMFLDGVEVYSSPGTAPVAPTTGTFVGGYMGAASRFFAGKIDEVACYGSALTADRFAARVAAAG